MDGESTNPNAGMMLKAKLAPHLIHDHEWEQMASQIQPKRISDMFAGAKPGGATTTDPNGTATPMRAVSAMDGPVDPQYRQPTSPLQQNAQLAERSARMDPTKTRTPAYTPTNPDGGAKITQNIAPGITAGVGGGRPAAPRREASNPLTGDEGSTNRVSSGPISGGLLGGGRSFSNPTSKGIYDSHVRTLFPQTATMKRTPLRSSGAPAMA
jgi:hypothetical protein